MATQTRRRNRNGGDPAKQEKGRGREQQPQSDYEETPDYGTMFHRPDNEGKQPQFTGTGVLDDDTLDAIKANGGEFQIAGWTGRTRGGTKRMRIHIEPPYDGGGDGDDSWDDDEDDVPF